jgi:hypothetical protein
MTDSVLRRAKIGREDRAELFLVGGATRTPLVATLLGQATGRSPRRVEHPELAVAEGALQYLAMAANEPPPRPRTRQLPVMDAPPVTPAMPAPIRDGSTVRESVTVVMPAAPVAAPAPFAPPPRQQQDKLKLVPNPYRHHSGATFRFAGLVVAGLVAGAFDGVLFTALSWLLLAVGLAGAGFKLFQWILSSRDTRPTTIDRNGITITLNGHDAVFPWTQMATVYFLEHRFSRWLVCTPGSNSTLGSDHLTARFWSRPHSVFFLTSVSGFGDQLVREGLETYAGDRYQH